MDFQLLILYHHQTNQYPGSLSSKELVEAVSELMTSVKMRIFPILLFLEQGSEAAFISYVLPVASNRED